MNVNVDDIECDESIVVINITKEVDSIDFKNAIIQSILSFELPEFEKDIKEMNIEEDFGNDYFGDLIIKNYYSLESIYINNNSLQNLNSMKICNNSELKTIEVENGEEWEDNGVWCSSGVGRNITCLRIESNNKKVS